MARWGRKGSVPWIYEVIISLILVALCGLAMFTYIEQNATSEGFFAKYHAADVATIAELAAAPQGDVILRYDNIRPDMDLTFWLANGRVAVARPGTLSEEQEPSWATVRQYAPVAHYDPTTLDAPDRLVFTRRDEKLAILDQSARQDACPSPTQPQVPVSDARLWLDLSGALTPTEREEAARAFRETLAPTQLTIASDAKDATVTIKVLVSAGTRTSVATQPGGEDAVAIACDFAQQLRTLTLADVSFTAPSATSGPILADTTLVLGNEDRITPTQIGKAAAFALARRYR